MRTLYFEGDGEVLGPARRTWLGPAFRHGDAIFETIRVDAGHPRGLGFHLQRLAAGLRSAGIAPVPEATLRQAVERALDATHGQEVRLRLVVEEGMPQAGAPGAPRLWVEAVAPAAPDAALRERGLRVGLATIPHPGLGAWGKSASYQPFAIALREARAAGWDDALLRRGEHVLEATRAALVWKLGKVLYRVDLALGPLASTTLARLEAGCLCLRSAGPDLLELQAADAVALVNVGGALGVGELAGRRFAAPDRLAAELRSLIDDAPDEP